MYMKQYLLIILDAECSTLDVIAKQLITTDKKLAGTELKKAVKEFMDDNALEGELFDLGSGIKSLKSEGAWALSESYVMKCIEL